MKSVVSIKFLFIFGLCVMCLLYVYLKNIRIYATSFNDDNVVINVKSDVNYILLWTGSKNSHFQYFGEGTSGFKDKKCQFTNCYATEDKSLLGDYTKFDVIAFNGPQISNYESSNLPSKRSPRQKYAFATLESSHYYPVCNTVFDGFFNWTWTYKLNSDARWGYVVVRDVNGTIIGPNTNMSWKTDMEPVSEEIKTKLKTKNKAAAWFVSNCKSKSKHEVFVEDLKRELTKFNLSVDVYGKCGPLRCPSNEMYKCLKSLEDDYYFYLSFENSLSEDYVTEKLVHALNHTTVPVVYGGANYSRFMPEGTYLNARELGAQNLAQTMNDLIKDPGRYAEFFRFKKYYTYHLRKQTPETDDYCRFCAMLNDKELLETKSVYTKFREWWNVPGTCRGS